MTAEKIFKALWLPLVALALFLTAAIFRPLFPIDETRYMSVAWEMISRNGWLQPLTMNFEPYHHKPPLLFWLIGGFWEIFGIHRWVGLIPATLASLGCVYLTAILGNTISRVILKESPSTDPQSLTRARTRVWLLMAGSLPFMIYGTLIMFDFLVCACVLGALIFIVRYSGSRSPKDLILIGLCAGIGILAKGPVALLYTLPVFLLAPFWAADFKRPAAWYGSVLLAILISAIPVLLWLIPVLQAADNHFAFWLIWNQTAGRVTGNFSAAHVRPFYFYLPLLPLLLMPWLFFPAFWIGIKSLKTRFSNDKRLKFLACWFIPVFLAFSIIHGKQPHYLLPLLPALVLLLADLFKHVSLRTLAKTTAVMVTLFVMGQAVASATIFKRYDLTAFAAILEHKKEHHPLAYVSNYNAEFGFLAHITEHIEDIPKEKLADWFSKHPDGLAIVRYNNDSDMAAYHPLATMFYRGRKLGLFMADHPTE